MESCQLSHQRGSGAVGIFKPHSCFGFFHLDTSEQTANEKFSETRDQKAPSGTLLHELTVDRFGRKQVPCCNCGWSETINASCIWKTPFSRLSRLKQIHCHRLIRFLSSDCNLHLHARLDVNDDLLHNLRRCVEINQTLVDAHLIRIPSLTPLTARRFPRGDF